MIFPYAAMMTTASTDSRRTKHLRNFLLLVGRTTMGQNFTFQLRSCENALQLQSR